MTLRRSAPSGFTLVELMVVVVLGTLVLLALYEVLITNQRTYAVQSASAQVQQTLRAGASVLYGELREISPAQGDLVTMGSNAIEIRSGRAFGSVCGTPGSAGSDPTLTVLKQGSFFSDGDSVTVFTENDPTTTTDDVWQTGAISDLTTTGITCPSTTLDAQTMTVSGITFGSPPDSIEDGAVVRAFVHYRYQLATVDGDWFLVRKDQDGTTEPMVGPVDASDGLSFTYLDSSGSTTATASSVAQIVATIRSTSTVRDAAGNLVGDSTVLRIFPRN